jgi:hypothetical protein
MDKYLKFIVAVIGAIEIGLQTQWPNARWSESVTAGITALLVYFVPNNPTPPKGP